MTLSELFDTYDRKKRITEVHLYKSGSWSIIDDYFLGSMLLKYGKNEVLRWHRETSSGVKRANGSVLAVTID